ERDVVRDPGIDRAGDAEDRELVVDESDLRRRPGDVRGSSGAGDVTKRVLTRDGHMLHGGEGRRNVDAIRTEETADRRTSAEQEDAEAARVEILVGGCAAKPNESDPIAEWVAEAE